MNPPEMTQKTAPKRSQSIEYINPNVPEVERPAYVGTRYERLVPDTLELQEMARLAVNGLTAPTDEEADYELYWQASFTTNPPLMWHNESDIVQAKFIEALPLLRLACGSGQNAHVEQRWMEVIRQMQGPDGLLYLPKIGRPWCKFGAYGAAPPGDHYFTAWLEGRLLGAMTIYYLLTGDEEWRAAGQRIVDGLNALAIHEGPKAHFACHEFGTDGQYTPPEDPASAQHNPAAYVAWCIQGLANYARKTAYEPALDLAGKLSHWVIEDSGHFAPDGSFLPEYPSVTRAHFHGHTAGLLSMLDYGLAASDQEVIDFVHRGFKYGMGHGECLLGYFGEWLNVSWPVTLELCELADMIALALKLSAGGVGDYWDMADRWIRNLFYEGQLRRADWVYWRADRSGELRRTPEQIPPYHTADRVVERNIGAFGSGLMPNDWLPDYPWASGWTNAGIAHCCTGNATRTIYYAWENALSHAGDRLRINLLMNRASPWADVDSHIPYKGQVDVHVKQSLDLSIRIPEWVDPKETGCVVSGQDRELRFEGRYAMVGPVAGGQTVTLVFPISERSEWIVVERRRYHVLMRGNTCVAIDPPGSSLPLFQRDFYREDVTRWREITRFVSEQSIDW